MEKQNLENQESIWKKIQNERGGIAQIHEVFRDYTEGVEAHYEFYKKVVLSSAPQEALSRLEREYLAFRVSQHNQCTYCYTHHKAAFDNCVEVSCKNISSEKRVLLDELAQSLTQFPWKTPLLKKRFVEIFNEVQWKHAVMVVGYFNMANRLAFAMDVELESYFSQTCL